MRGTRGLVGWVAVAVLACAAAASGCVATEQAAAPRGVAVNGPPPAPLLEAQRAQPPSPNAVWIAGYWHWTGMQYSWIPGHWESGRPGATWSAPQYVTADGSYFYEAGGWRASGRGTPGPSGPASTPGHASALR